MNKIRKKLKEKIKNGGLTQSDIAENIRTNKASLSLFMSQRQNLNGASSIYALEYLVPGLKEEIEKW